MLYSRKLKYQSWNSYKINSINASGGAMNSRLPVRHCAVWNTLLSSSDSSINGCCSAKVQMCRLPRLMLSSLLCLTVSELYQKEVILKMWRCTTSSRLPHLWKLTNLWIQKQQCLQSVAKKKIVLACTYIGKYKLYHQIILKIRLFLVIKPINEILWNV